ncbi:NACHT domain-containing protein [Chamaesiphon sp. OTE_75_metabat_556]|uniref:NACHT domain-containing protein n=1 Tax=Chamaesiphon sp. OTE_75_metabat_556 TaxID=2964692 RepID=UPI00286A91A7|nr:NACHT domain-containing protein [Chamaesiphon sp. OTE_75_metabat_556]
MPRPNYGNAVKQRTVQFFTVLVDYANDELDIDDRLLESLQRDIQLHWQTPKRCVVRTKVRYLEQLTKLVNATLTGEQIKEAIKCLTDFLEIVEDNRASKGGSETWHFTLNLWHDRFDRAANLDRLGQEWDYRKSPQNAPQSAIESQAVATTDYWWELMRSSLTAQQYQRITTNPLMGEDRLKFSLEEVYVPLDLRERQRETMFEVQTDLDRVGEENSANSIGDIDCLLTRLITNPEPNRIAIIGEPGAGKTTCLQKLAAGLLERKLLPIWISLADLQGETLTDYLLQDWLKLATRQIAIDSKLQQDFAAQFESGRVWLLLDAVDEMAIPQRGGFANDASIALARIERQLRGWIGSAHVILTCRSNVWDSGKNALENFTTYRNLSLSNGYNGASDRVRQFIQGWFRAQPALGENLSTELAQPQYQRLRDAVKNPLRLALLCRYWLLTQGKLPSTKASLYQQFTDTIYAWKQDRFPTSLSQRQQLNTTLGKLALQALSSLEPSGETRQERVRFRLHEHTVLAVMAPDLLELALQLGWLNKVGISVSTGAKIYAFYHSTFQEYFAARSIDDWQYFSTGTVTSHAPIFSPYWQETILFWFGRGDITSSEKEAFIAALINFDRSHGGFHYYRAYFLAAAAIAEFPESNYTQQIIDRLLQWRFAKFVPDLHTWKYYPLPIQDGARVALRQTDRAAAISGLEKLVQTIENPFICWQAAHSLGKVFDPGNTIAVRALINSIDLVTNGDLIIKICESLAKIDPNHHQIVTSTLVNAIHTGKTEALIRKAAFTLGKILLESAAIEDDDSLLMLAINTLTRIIEANCDTPADSLRQSANQRAALDNLHQIAPTHPAANIRLVSDRTLPSSNRKRRKKVADPRNIAIAIGELEQKLATINNAESKRRYAYQLGKFQAGHPLAVAALLQLISSSQPHSFYKLTGEYLKEITLPEQLPLIVTQLQDRAIAVEQGDRSTATLTCYKLLWYCAEQLPNRQFIEIWDR